MESFVSTVRARLHKDDKPTGQAEVTTSEVIPFREGADALPERSREMLWSRDSKPHTSEDTGVTIIYHFPFQLARAVEFDSQIVKETLQ